MGQVFLGQQQTTVLSPLHINHHHTTHYAASQHHAIIQHTPLIKATLFIYISPHLYIVLVLVHVHILLISMYFLFVVRGVIIFFNFLYEFRRSQKLPLPAAKMTRVRCEFIKTYIFNLEKQQLIVAILHTILKSSQELDFN